MVHDNLLRLSNAAAAINSQPIASLHPIQSAFFSPLNRFFSRPARSIRQGRLIFSRVTRKAAAALLFAVRKINTASGRYVGSRLLRTLR
jgi:hypothetical protein